MTIRTRTCGAPAATNADRAAFGDGAGHTCERIIEDSGQCGLSATWALVGCCATSYLCAGCFEVIYHRWSTQDRVCRNCMTVYSPGITTFSRIVPLNQAATPQHSPNQPLPS